MLYRFASVAILVSGPDPVFPATTAVVHAGFEDPPALVPESATEADALAVYRRVRDEIRVFVEGLPDSLPAPKP